MDLDFLSVIKQSREKKELGQYPATFHTWSVTHIYYMAVPHKNWELPNSRIWLAEMDIERGLDFPI